MRSTIKLLRPPFWARWLLFRKSFDFRVLFKPRIEIALDEKQTEMVQLILQRQEAQKTKGLSNDKNNAK